MRHRTKPLTFRLLAILGISFLLSSCWIEGVFGPQKLRWNSVANYGVEFQLWDAGSGTWHAHLAVDVPIGWDLLSSHYWGDYFGTPVYGVGTLLDEPFPPWTCNWPAPPAGYKRLRIVTEEEPGQGPTITPSSLQHCEINARLRFRVGGSPGDKNLHFGMTAGGNGWGGCSNETDYPVTVVREWRVLGAGVDVNRARTFDLVDWSDTLFSDCIESGDTSAWSTVVGEQ